MVELIIAVSLFAVIAFFSLGSLLSIYDANRKSQSSKTITDNLNMAIEDMARTIRFGNTYCLGMDTVPPADSSSCPTGGGDAITVTFNGNRIIYRKNGTALQRSDNWGATYTNITSADTKIEYLKFYVFGTATTNTQPYAVAVIKGYVGAKPTTKTTFSIETLMSQRALNI